MIRRKRVLSIDVLTLCVIAFVVAFFVAAAIVAGIQGAEDSSPRFNLAAVAIGVAAGWGAAVAAYRKFGWQLVVDDGARCFGCGYDLTGNESGQCPECGQQTNAARLQDSEGGPVEPERGSSSAAGDALAPEDIERRRNT